MNRRADLLAMLALAVLALALRLPGLEATGELKSDEAFEYLSARRIAREGERPSVGLPTTDGPRVPPHRLYVFALPLFVADGPVAVMAFVALLHGAAAAAAFGLGRRDLGRRTALALGVLLAASPALVRHGRWIWGPNLLPPLGVFLLLALARARRRPAAASAALPIATLLAHIHYAAVGLGGLGLVAWVRSARRARWHALVLGAGLSIAVATPFALHELTHDFPETRRALGVAGGARPPAEEAPARLLIVVHAARPLLPSSALDALAPAPDTGLARLAVDGVVVLLVVAGAALGLRDLARRAPSSAALGLLFAACGVVPFLVLPIPVRPHYGLVATPGLALCAAAALARLPRGLSTAGLAALALAGILTTGEVHASLRRGGGSPGGGYDVALGPKLDACRFLIEHDLVLRGCPRTEYALLLDEALRELERRDPRAASERFTRVPYPDPGIRYWLSNVRVPFPRHARGLADLRLVPPDGPPLPGEEARFGPVAVVVARS